MNESYFCPETKSCADEYRKAVPSLTIFEAPDIAIVSDLKTRVEELERENIRLKNEWKADINKVIESPEFLTMLRDVFKKKQKKEAE